LSQIHCLFVALETDRWRNTKNRRNCKNNLITTVTRSKLQESTLHNKVKNSKKFAATNFSVKEDIEQEKLISPHDQVDKDYVLLTTKKCKPFSDKTHTIVVDNISSKPIQFIQYQTRDLNLNECACFFDRSHF
jgi:DNA repair exonuclease SbcCD nuclease subunit